MKNDCPYQRDSKYCVHKNNKGSDCIYKNCSKCEILQTIIKNAPESFKAPLKAIIESDSTTKYGYKLNKKNSSKRQSNISHAPLPK